MSSERHKVLEMLAAGKITPIEAEKLLERLPSAVPDGTAKTATDGARPRAPRYLRIVVDSPNRDSVNIRVPFGLIRTGIKLSTLVPGRVGRRLSEQGIDLSHLGKLNDEELIAELAALQVDVARDDGETVRIYCE